MRILILVPYYKPETVGPVVWIEQLTEDLLARGHQVTVLCAMPHFPAGIVFKEFRGKLFQREVINGVEVIRTWIYSTSDKTFWPRLLNWGSFCITSLVFGLFALRRIDAIFDILWPLPLGVTGDLLARAKGAKLVVNVQDMYPDIAIELGMLRSKRVIRFFKAMEKWIYKRSKRVVVISEGFRENLLAKGVPDEKIAIVPNWADPDFIQPGPKENDFRRELNVGDRFTVVYSGGLTHNSNLEPVLQAAKMVEDEPFAFVIVGDGVHKEMLLQMAQDLDLKNLIFKPFQSLERYPEVLLASDLTLVTLNNQCSLASVPSKIYKQMAAGRPVLAITAPGNEVDAMVKTAQCGLCVPPDDPAALADAFRWAASHPKELETMGVNSRSYLEKNHSREQCVGMIDAILREVVSER